MIADRENAIREAASNIDASTRDTGRAAERARTVETRAASPFEAAKN
jgi:hypothetical protein